MEHTEIVADHTTDLIARAKPYTPESDETLISPPSSNPPTRWRNRIVGHALVAPQTLKENPKNWRMHPEIQKRVVEGLLDEVGWIQEIAVNVNTGVMVDGHLRLELALRENETEVPVKYLDLTQEEEDKVLATLDPSSALAVTNSQKLEEVLKGFTTHNEFVRNLVDTLRSQAEETQADYDDLVDQAKQRQKRAAASLNPDDIKFQLTVRVNSVIERDNISNLLLSQGYTPEIKAVKQK